MRAGAFVLAARGLRRGVFVGPGHWVKAPFIHGRSTITRNPDVAVTCHMETGGRIGETQRVSPDREV